MNEAIAVNIEFNIFVPNLNLYAMATFSTKSIANDTGKLGLRVALAIILVVFLFGVCNVSTFIFSIFHFATLDEITSRILASGGVFAIGVLFTVVAAYLTYKYLIIYGLSLVYPYLTSFFKKICVILVDKATSLGSAANIKRSHIEKTINTGDILNETYEKKVPWIVKKGVSFIIGFLPFASLLTETKIQDVIRSGDREKAGELLYYKMDEYIRTEIFAANSIKWVFFLFVLNIIVQGLLIYFVSR